MAAERLRVHALVPGIDVSHLHDGDDGGGVAAPLLGAAEAPVGAQVAVLHPAVEQLHKEGWIRMFIRMPDF